MLWKLVSISTAFSSSLKLSQVPFESHSAKRTDDISTDGALNGSLAR